MQLLQLADNWQAVDDFTCGDGRTAVLQDTSVICLTFELRSKKNQRFFQNSKRASIGHLLEYKNQFRTKQQEINIMKGTNTQIFHSTIALPGPKIQQRLLAFLLLYQRFVSLLVVRTGCKC